MGCRGWGTAEDGGTAFYYCLGLQTTQMRQSDFRVVYRRDEANRFNLTLLLVLLTYSLLHVLAGPLPSCPADEVLSVGVAALMLSLPRLCPASLQLEAISANEFFLTDSESLARED